jgi:hypothetical protein
MTIVKSVCTIKRIAAVLILGAVVFSACSQPPTSPSQLSPTGVSGAPWGSIFGVMDSQAAGLVLDWLTLTRSTGAAMPLPIGEDAPGAPLNLAFGVSGTTVTLTWGPPGSGPTTASYVLQAGTGPGLSNIVNFNTGSTAGTFTATSVPSGTYYVRVRAANVDGLGDASNEVTIVVMTGAPCLAPNAPSALTSSVAGASLSLSWSAPAAGCVSTGYVIEAGSSPGSSNLANFNTGSTATTFSAAAVPTGTYYVRVRAANGAGVGPPSNEATVIVGTSPPTPVNGRWVGVAPDGIIPGPPVPNDGGCDTAYDLQLDLTTTGTVVTGTAITRLRDVAPLCSESPGSSQTWSVINGTVGSGTISFTLQITSRPPELDGYVDFSGTFTATRMTGRSVGRDDSGAPFRPGSLAVNRQ